MPKVMESADNPLTEEKIELGRILYYEPRMSASNDISCNSCHILDEFGVDGLATSPGHDGTFGPRNSPTVYNAANHVAQFWDGREPTIEAQAKGPILNPVEHGMPTAESVEEVLRGIEGYRPYFEAAFPGQDEPITFDNVALAIMERRVLDLGEQAELEQRLGAMSQQVETLERIVNLKDDQIAALQKALAEVGDAAQVGDAVQSDSDGLADAGAWGALL